MPYQCGVKVITKNYCTPVNVREMKAAFEELKAKVKPEIDWLYETKCDRCGGKATTVYTVYSQIFQCPRCLTKIPLIDCIEIDVGRGEKGGGKGGIKRLCPHCYKFGIEEKISPKGNLKLGFIPVIVGYYCNQGCNPKKRERKFNSEDNNSSEYFKRYDLSKLNEIEKDPIPYWFPKITFIRGDRYIRDGLVYNNIDTVADFYTKQNLWAIAIIKNEIEKFSDERIKNSLLFCLTSILLNVSKMTTNRDRLGFLKGTYYIPQVFRCTNVFGTLENKFRLMITGWNELESLQNTNLIISTDDAQLLQIPSNSIDYIFTDPPYGDKEQYGELNFVWEAWLNFDTSWLDKEIVVNEVRGIYESDWIKKMQNAMSEAYRVLKPGHWVSLCYHDTSEARWTAIQDMMAESGFIIDKLDSALFIDTGQKSYNQKVADQVTKRDLVINFRKPFIGEISNNLTITNDDDSKTLSEKIITIIRDFLGAHPGTTKDRIYDEVVSRMVRAGQMETHNFEDLLGRVAEPNKPEGSTGNGLRWYLKETELNAVDSAETMKEDAAYEKISKFVTEFLKKNPENEGVHYSDLFEHYIYAVKDKPRRALVDWLLDYFYKTEEGTYRLPITEEEKKIKSEGRAKGIARRIRHYIAHLEQGIPIREQDRPSDTTLADWLRHCRRAGMYEQGKVLYEKGGIRIDRLPENQQVAVEEDYMVCVRNLARGVGKAPKAAKRKKKSDVITL
jgi:hypothetical protein